MNFIIKIILSLCLFVQFSFADTKLVYKQKGFKGFASYLNSEPTIDDAAKMVALGHMDVNLLKIIRKTMKERGLSKKQRTASVEVIGNRIVVEGLKKPIIIGNSDKIELSYDGEKIALSDPKDFSKTVKDIDDFFNSKSGESASYFLYKNLILGSEAKAFPVILAIILGIMVLGAGGMAWISSSFRKGPDVTWQNEWPFDIGNLGEKINLKCKDSKFVITSGKEEMTFGFEENFVMNGRIIEGKDASIFPAYTISYHNPKGKDAGKMGSFTYDVNISKEAKTDGRFADPYFTPARKETMLEIAKVVCGEDGGRKLCKGNEFADGDAATYKELITYYNKLRSENSPHLATEVKKMDKGDRSK